MECNSQNYITITGWENHYNIPRQGLPSEEKLQKSWIRKTQHSKEVFYSSFLHHPSHMYKVQTYT